MTADLIRRYATPLPRYTSYPTANHFSAAVGPGHHRRWIEGLPQAASLSLYVHIPFCHELCWYCGCNTKATRRYQPVRRYLTTLFNEIDAVSAQVPRSHSVSHIHWGGGSPNILAPEDIERLAAALRRCFDVALDAEFAVEIDPRLLNGEQADAFARAGVNRISLGVQDFDPVVQGAIGRIQSFEQTAGVVDQFRRCGIGSINIDLVYGLPHQTEASVARTIAQALSLEPDRLAIFGYAHLPSRLKHQRLIDESALPGPVERFRQARLLARLLTEAGYVEIGLDHYARPADGLARQPLARNFQGYTTDRSDALIGLGASAISRFADGYDQNAVAIEDYAGRVAAEGLATVRGCVLSEDDRVRAAVIERLMCDFTFSGREFEAEFGKAASEVLRIAADVVRANEDGLIEPTESGFRLTAKGRPFVRTIAAKFDAYLTAEVEKRRHALSV